MKHTLGIRREDLNKKGEQRVAIDPNLANKITEAGFTLMVQPASHPVTGENKRAFSDKQYLDAGAMIQEDLSKADIIFGLKEISKEEIEPQKVYLFFSHTHKGQVKNRELLKTLVERKATLIDYELIQNSGGQRVITAFTYMAGYAGMIDSLWTLGKKWNLKGISSPIQEIPQSVVSGDLTKMKALISKVGENISKTGTPQSQPPLITAFLGNGRTSFGAQSIYDLLPTKEIKLEDIPEVYRNGNRKFVYKWVADIPELFRPKTGSHIQSMSLTTQEYFQQYLAHPEEFESNLDKVFPYCTMWMNCIIWSPKYPRLITRAQAKEWYNQSQTLQVIGDITCDPEGAIEFSRETWIDDPVFNYYPDSQKVTQGFSADGISVMAVTNLPCEFSADASAQFSTDIEPFIQTIISMDTDADQLSSSGLPEEIAGATILWRGAFTPPYHYMEEYIRT